MQKTMTDRIERSVVIEAPRAKVWKALTDAREFGQWFGVNLEGPFALGAKTRGRITIENYTHVIMDVEVVKLEKERAFSWRWHPHAVEKDVDYSGEPTTLVEFTLEDARGGTKLTVIESGFDALPEARRALALRGNTGGWEFQMERIATYVRSRA